jgi:hypothetical protein
MPDKLKVRILADNFQLGAAAISFSTTSERKVSNCELLRLQPKRGNYRRYRSGKVVLCRV